MLQAISGLDNQHCCVQHIFMCNNYIVHPKLTEHCKSTVIEKNALKQITGNYEIYHPNNKCFNPDKKKVTWNYLILFHMVKLPYKREAKWYGAQGFSNGHS